jgi:hypothetical protein
MKGHASQRRVAERRIFSSSTGVMPTHRLPILRLKYQIHLLAIVYSSLQTYETFYFGLVAPRKSSAASAIPFAFSSIQILIDAVCEIKQRFDRRFWVKH